MFATTLLLQLVLEGQVSGSCAVHLDFKVDSVIEAVDERVDIGATVERSPDLYPDDEPFLDWAVMPDPFGNAYCLIRYPL